MQVTEVVMAKKEQLNEETAMNNNLPSSIYAKNRTTKPTKQVRQNGAK